jgi:hypothetical protein
MSNPYPPGPPFGGQPPAPPGFSPPGYGPPQPGGWGQLPPGFGAPPAGYEFSEVENVTIRRASTWALILSGCMFLDVVLNLIELNFKGAAFRCVFAVLMLMAGLSFKSVVETRGQDVKHLMDAIEKLGYIFIARAVLVVLAFIAMVLFMSCGAVIGLAR